MKRRSFIGTLIAGLGAMAAPIRAAKKPVMLAGLSGDYDGEVWGREMLGEYARAEPTAIGGVTGHFPSPQRTMMFAAMVEQQQRVPTANVFPRISTGYEISKT